MDELQDEIVNLEERNDGIEMVLVDEDEIPPIQKPFAFFDEESLPLFFWYSFYFVLDSSLIHINKPSPRLIFHMSLNFSLMTCVDNAKFK